MYKSFFVAVAFITATTRFMR